MPTTTPAPKNLPLPVRIFHAAMAQQLSLSDYAQSIGISSDGLQAAVTAPPDQVEPAILDQLAGVYQQSREMLRDHLPIAAPQESFAAWLKRNMESISQHALRARAQLDAKTLKRFLNGGLLPDSDQAERLARALYIDRAELARVVIANMIHGADSARPAATTSTGADPHTPVPAPISQPTIARLRSTRRPKALPDTELPSAHAAIAHTAALATPAPKAEPPQRAAARRQGHAHTTTTGGEPEAIQRRSTPAAPIPAAAPTAEAAADPLPAPVVKPPAPRAADRQADSTAAERETITTHSASAPTAQDSSRMAASEVGTVPTSDTHDRRAPRKQRRAASASAHSAAAVTEPVMIARATKVPASGGARGDDRAAEAAPPSELTRALGAVEPSPPAETPAAALAISTSPAAPEPVAVASILAVDTTALELTPDEVRLIRHWRHLHPHGRRATLHYIGSLLVDE